MNQNIPISPCPENFVEHTHIYKFYTHHSKEKCWKWLMTPETFTKGQIWPWKVEFLKTKLSNGSIVNGFDIGTRNTHHGPLIHFCGVITDIGIDENIFYRDLHYTYGAYAISFRLIRPVLLKITVEDKTNTNTSITVQIDSHVRKGMYKFWSLMQFLFWPTFKFSLHRSLKK